MLFDLRFAPKRFGPLMSEKVILSHSGEGGEEEEEEEEEAEMWR